MNTGGAGFLGGHGLRPFGHGRVPRGGHRQRHGEDRPVAVDDVQREEHRDARRAFLDGDLLQLIEPFGVVQPEERPGPGFADDLVGFGAGHEVGPADLRQLGDLLVEGHF